jgi:hypothetical protein
MGFSCVADGSNPHSMGYYLMNESSKQLTLSNQSCTCNDKHTGFSVYRGKFKQGWQPQSVIEADEDSKCWMSGREGDVLLGPTPAGWVKYDIEGGGTLIINYDYDGWGDLENVVFLQAVIYNSSSTKVLFMQKNIKGVISNGFEDSDVNRQFLIEISNSNDE